MSPAAPTPSRPRHSRAVHWLLALCVVAFAAAVVGAIYCGERIPGASPERAERLRLLIYGHFAMAQVALAAAGWLVYKAHRRWRRYYLVISYNEKGMHLSPPGIRMPEGRVYRCHLGGITRAQLPPAGAPVVVYPMLMQSGRSSGERMEAELRRAYAGERPSLYYQPVLGASPWLARAAAAYISPLLADGVGVLVVAHGATLAEPPPEPTLFCRRLRELLPGGVEVCLCYINQTPSAVETLAAMSSTRVLLLPFLLTEGVHTARDLPTEADAAACGKSLCRLPVAAELLQPDTTDTP